MGFYTRTTLSFTFKRKESYSTILNSCRHLKGTLLLFLCMIAAGISSFAQAKNSVDIFKPDNLIAWCIVPFDSKHRGPKERVDMLKQLGFSKYAYDWRHEHLATFPEEIKISRQSNISITAVWMWIDKQTDSPGKLSVDNEKLLEILRETGLNTQLWVGFNNNFFEYETEKEKIEKGVEMIQYLRSITKPLSTGIGLYNHGDWFGEPDNQLKILNEIKDSSVGLIYNFHHAHMQVDRFPELLQKMMPWLWTVNINGMKKEGPQILPVGEGDEELGMIKKLKTSGFNGTIGILGHVDTKDVKEVLQKNLDGLKLLKEKL